VHHDAFHQQPDDLLAVRCGGPGCPPQRRDVSGQGQDPGALGFAHLRRLCPQEAVVFVFQPPLLTQGFLPSPFQGTGDQAALGLDGLVLTLGTLRLGLVKE